MLSRLITRNFSVSSHLLANKNVVLIDGARTPFARSSNEFDGIWPYDLQREALSGLLKRNPKVDPKTIGRVVCGCVIMDVSTSNIAREAALAAGIPMSVPCNTVTLACISSNVAINQCVADIQAGNYDIAIAGGVDVMSDAPIRWPRKARHWMINHGQRIGKVGIWNTLKNKKSRPSLSMLGVELPAVAEFSSGETMGKSGDRLAAAFGITREEQDDFAFRSHTLAKQATQAGHLKDVLKVFVPGRSAPISTDCGINPDLEKSKKLKPAFIKPHGTVTAANASFLSDGASACLIMSEDKAKELKLQPMAYIRDSVYVAQDPIDQLLLGPAYAANAILNKTGTTFKDYDVFEIHEAFAGQVLANIKAMGSDEFCIKNMGRKDKVGDVPLDKLNAWGGSLSIGHPFAATGVRLLTQAAMRLKAENGKKALITACAAGGHAYGGVIERYPGY